MLRSETNAGVRNNALEHYDAPGAWRDRRILSTEITDHLAGGTREAKVGVWGSESRDDARSGGKREVTLPFAQALVILQPGLKTVNEVRQRHEHHPN